MTNNDILKKLRVALKLTNDDIVAIMKLVDFQISKSELGALFRKEDHPKYMECGDQFLRNFLNGLIIHLRGPMENKKPTNPPKTKPLYHKAKGFDTNKLGKKGKTKS
tara:strand:- start:5568 stop:5888 length:321 start_codon:yes stop_codon:yes gene_type:complete